MCGIVGFIGKRQATPILLQGLEKLEYRGYDSAGIAVQDHGVQIVKTQGRIANLRPKTTKIHGFCGIGHTRWATHGEPSVLNAHPQASLDNKVALVHNGIIENHAELKAELERLGYTFRSQTDTEVIAMFLAHQMRWENSPLKAMQAFMRRARGAYAVAALFDGYEGEIYAMRKESPLIIGISKGELHLASDVAALLPYTRQVYYLGDQECAKLTAERVEFYGTDGLEIEKILVEITWNAECAEKEGYPHFMLKEIHEQPKAVQNTLQAFAERGTVSGLTPNELAQIEQIYIVACGSAYHAGLVAQYVIERVAKLPVRVAFASEFRYQDPILTERTLVVVISQSGETADSLAALREAKKRGVKTIAIVNVVGSSIAREAERVFYTVAGPEIAVATTKAYSTQLIAGYLLALELGTARKTLNEAEYDRLLEELKVLPNKIERILKNGTRIEALSKPLRDTQNIFFIGRGVDYAVSMEGSLKMKEISYVHSEAYAAGELKHGTLSLIEKDVWTVSVLTQARLSEKMLSNMTEIKSRKGKLLAIATEGIELQELADEKVLLPQTDELFSASLAVIPLQLLSYYTGVAKGLDVDKPRNLAKSVTVE